MTNHNPGLETSAAPDLDPSLTHEVMSALDKVAKGAKPGAFDGQEGLAEWAAQCARLIGYSDSCERCGEGAGDGAQFHNTGRYPIAAVVTRPEGDSENEGSLLASYQCHVCGHEWTCGWSIGAPWLFS